MKIRTLLIAAALTVPTLAVQADIFESEPNNTRGTADPITRGVPNWADVGIMRLANGGGDVDFFSIELFAGEILTVITTPMEIPFVDPDTMLALFDSSGTELVFNDDAGNGLGSAIRWETLTDGTYYIGVTGFNDRDFVGDHDHDGTYALTVSIVIPAPAGLAAIAGGLFFGPSRRRRA